MLFTGFRAVWRWENDDSCTNEKFFFDTKFGDANNRSLWRAMLNAQKGGINTRHVIVSLDGFFIISRPIE